MDANRASSTPRVRMTLAERKKETREALLFAALGAFSQVGYNAASLEAIATDAGYSKGAIYSNFDGKAELFLAVMDYNLEMLGGGWDPLAVVTEPDAEPWCPPAEAEGDAADLVRGFGLATLEFIATAARDDKLTEALRQRVQSVVDVYQGIADSARPTDEDLTGQDIARLMAALDQGMSLLTLSGITEIDGGLMRAGLQRLLDPRSAREPRSAHADRTSPLPVVGQVQRLLEEPPPDH